MTRMMSCLYDVAKKKTVFLMLSQVSAVKKYVHLLLLTLICYLWMKYGTFFLAHFPGKTWISQFLHDFLCPLVSKKEPFAIIGTVYSSHHPTKTFRTLKRIRSNHPLASSVLDPPP